MAAVLYAAEQEKEEEEKKSRAEQEEERPFPVDGSGWSRWARALKGAEARSPARHPPLGQTEGQEILLSGPLGLFERRGPAGRMRLVRSVRSYRQISGDCRCKYTAGLALLLEEHLKDHNIGDMTDAAGQYIIESTLWGKLMKQTKGPGASHAPGAQAYLKDKKLYVSFKTGGGRMFVIKNLEEFCEHVKNGEEAIYGSSTVLSHKRENFTEALSRGWSM